MVGKFIFGALSGGVLVIGGLILGSALFPLQPQTAEPAPVVEEGAVAAPAAVETGATGPEPGPAEDQDAAQVAEATPEPSTAPDPQAEVAAASPTGTTTDALAGKAAAAEPIASTDAQPATEVAPPPVDPEASVEAPVAPEAPPQTAAPTLAEVAQPVVPLAPLPLPQLDTDAVLAALDESAQPVPEASAEASPSPAEPAPAEPAPAELAPAAPVAQPEAEVAEAKPAPEGVPESDPGALPEPEIAQMPEIEGGPVFKPAPGLGELSEEGVVTGRLPRIGDAAPEPAPEAEADTAETAPEADAADIAPIVAFAASFENPDAKPLLAIVLIDTGAADLDRAGLAALPFPVSFALDPLDPATPDRAAIYRAAGREVVMLATGLAAGANASDVEVSFQSMAQGLPEAVAVMDLANPAFQDSRPLASLVVPVVQAQGRGLLTWDLGLNAADQVARRQDVPAAVIFRDFATGGGDRAAVRRLLDRAVFKAGQEGRAVLAGEATADLVAALLEWTVEGKGATIALAPLTAVLTVE